jgi:hypothetical protein
MIRITDCQAERLTDAALLTHLRDTIEAVRARSSLAPDLRQILAAHLTELKVEMVAGTDMTPEAILALCEVSPDASAAIVDLRTREVA